MFLNAMLMGLQITVPLSKSVLGRLGTPSLCDLFSQQQV